MHVIHSSFKTGAESTGWNVSSFLSSLYYLFKDSPARRVDFKNVTGSSIMPLKFVNPRWLENIPVCERAIVIWEKIISYVEAVETKNVNTPNNKSYAVVKECTKAPCFLQSCTFLSALLCSYNHSC